MKSNPPHQRRRSQLQENSVWLLGVAGTTDYISRGITQSDSDPAIQGYIEPSYGLGPVLGDAFVNIWASSRC